VLAVPERGHKVHSRNYFQDGSIVFPYTEVPEPIEGRGIGSALARAALDYARDRGLSLLPLCPFVEHYIKMHPEDLPLVEPEYRARRFGDPED
jgi:uncharacterized protein